MGSSQKPPDSHNKSSNSTDEQALSMDDKKLDRFAQIFSEEEERLAREEPLPEDDAIPERLRTIHIGGFILDDVRISRFAEIFREEDLAEKSALQVTAFGVKRRIEITKSSLKRWWLLGIAVAAGVIFLLSRVKDTFDPSALRGQEKLDANCTLRYTFQEYTAAQQVIQQGESTVSILDVPRGQTPKVLASCTQTGFLNGFFRNTHWSTGSIDTPTTFEAIATLHPLPELTKDKEMRLWWFLTQAPFPNYVHSADEALAYAVNQPDFVVWSDQLVLRERPE